MAFEGTDLCLYLKVAKITIRIVLKNGAYIRLIVYLVFLKNHKVSSYIIFKSNT